MDLPLEAPAGSYAASAPPFDHILAAAPSQAAQAEMLDTAALLRELASLNGDAPAPQQAAAPTGQPCPCRARGQEAAPVRAVTGARAD